MVPLQAEISQSRSSQDSGETVPRAFRLAAPPSSAQVRTKGLILNVSESALVIETAADLAVGEIFLVHLPVMGSTEARVAWNCESYFGCEFLVPIAPDVLKAALRHSQLVESVPGADSSFVEMPVGKSPSLEEMAQWKSEFEKSNSASGNQLIGFRQTLDGYIIALVARTN